MSIYEEALKQAETEMGSAEITQLKEYFRQILEKIENKKSQKEKIEEEIRILKLELEDLKEGKMDKIKERNEKSKVAQGVSVIPINIVSTPNSTTWWAGTYSISSNGRTKTFYF